MCSSDLVGRRLQTGVVQAGEGEDPTNAVHVHRFAAVRGSRKGQEVTAARVAAFDHAGRLHELVGRSREHRCDNISAGNENGLVSIQHDQCAPVSTFHEAAADDVDEDDRVELAPAADVLQISHRRWAR